MNEYICQEIFEYLNIFEYLSHTAMYLFVSISAESQLVTVTLSRRSLNNERKESHSL